MSSGGAVTQQEAIQSLFELLGDEGPEGSCIADKCRITRDKFLRLTSSLGYNATEGGGYWTELVKFCRQNRGNTSDDDAAVDSLTAADIDALYGSLEYNPQVAAVALIGKIELLFRKIDTNNDDKICADELHSAIEDGLLENQWLDEWRASGGGAGEKKVRSIPIEIAEGILAAVDVDGTACLDLTEFTAAVLKVDPNSFEHVRRKTIRSTVRKGAMQRTTHRERVFIGSQINKDAMKRSLDEILSIKDFGSQWLIALFAAYPETRPLFGSHDVDVNPILLMLAKIIDSADNFEEFMPRLVRLGVKHVQMGIKYEYFEHLLYVMLDFFPDGVTAEERQMWIDLFALIYYTFMEARGYPELMNDESLYVGHMVEHGKDNPMLDPQETKAEEFVRYLAALADSHPTSFHSYVTRMFDGDFPDMKKAIAQFIDEHRYSFLEYAEAILLSKQQEDKIDSASDRHCIIIARYIDGIAAGSSLRSDLLEVFEDKSKVEERQKDGPGKLYSASIKTLLERSSYAGCIAAFWIDAKVAPPVYNAVLKSIHEVYPELHADDYAFLTQSSNPNTNGLNLEYLVSDLAKTLENREGMLQAVRASLELRVLFYDQLLSMVLKSYMDSTGVNVSGKCPFADKAADKVIPKVGTSAEALQAVIDLCRPHVSDNTWILDLGCRGGHFTRKLRVLDPECLVGVDPSEALIDEAKGEEEKIDIDALSIDYFCGKAVDVYTLMGRQFLELGLANSAEMAERFDIITAVSLFNGMSSDDMHTTGNQVLQLLRPKGRFIFCVPLSTLKHDTEKEEFMTLSDYLTFISNVGFILQTVTEFMTSSDDGNGILNQIAIQCRKPNAELARALSLMDTEDVHKEGEAADLIRMKEKRAAGAMFLDASAFQTNSDEFSVPPKEVLWSCIHYGDHFALKMSDVVRDELVASAKACIAKGIDANSYKPGDSYPMFNVKRFGLECADRLMRKDGNIIVQGLDVDSLADTEPERERLAKLCYYIIMTSTGIVNETRGRLFDVVDRGLDATKDNVLFSATSQECGWHSDGASKDWFPDMVNLLCVRPALKGGEFQITNTVNAYYDLCTRLPKFLMYELQRPLVRDILEKGATTAFGEQELDASPISFWFALSRHPDILRQRLLLNSYPVFERNESTRQHKFRYIDTWLKSGHAKAGLQVSPLLQLALAELEKSLFRHCRFDRRLERGEIAMANNHLVAHRRTEFFDSENRDEKR